MARRNKKNCCPECGQALPSAPQKPGVTGRDLVVYYEHIYWRVDGEMGAAVGEHAAKGPGQLRRLMKSKFAHSLEEAAFYAVELAALQHCYSLDMQRDSTGGWFFDTNARARRARTIIVKRANELLAELEGSAG